MGETMRQQLALLLVVTCLLVPDPAEAESGHSVVLKPMPGHTRLVLEKGNIVRGQCGGAVVTLLGVSPDSLHAESVLKFEGAGEPDLRLWTGTKDLSLSFAISDYNMVHCVETDKGEKLLVGSSCGGSLCTDARAHHVFNLRTGGAFPGQRAKKPCYFDCANRFLGKKYLSD
jgi:hypothetical protein